MMHPARLFRYVKREQVDGSIESTKSARGPVYEIEPREADSTKTIKIALDASAHLSG